MMSSLLVVSWLAASGSQAGPSCQLFRFQTKPTSVSARCSSVVEAAAERLKALLAVPEGERTFANTVRELDLLLADMEEEAAPLTVLREVSPSLPLRAAAEACNARVAKLALETLSRDDVYRALRSYADRREALDAEDSRLLDRLLDELRRNGVTLSGEDRARVRILKKALIDYELAYNRNNIEADDYVVFGRAELEGVPEEQWSLFERLPGGRFKVYADYAPYVAVMANCKVPATRKRLEAVNNNRTYPDNLVIQEEIVGLRRRVGRLMGYPNFAAFVLEDRMAGTPERVRAFNEELRERLAAPAAKQAAALLALKREDEPGAEKVYAWDTRYYENRLRQRGRVADPAAFAEYFPLERVLERLLAAAGEAFGLRFREVSPADAWHPDVRLFEGRDAATGALLGRFYLDPFNREGKVKSNPDYPLMSNRAGGEPCRMAMTVLVTNFRKPKGGPMLLQQGDLVNLLHGFGHVLHQLVSRPRHARFAGRRVEEDFVDVPSKVMENWAWDKEVLRRLSGHVKDGRPVPEEMVDGVVRSRAAFASLAYHAGTVPPLWDLDVHARDIPDISGHNRRLYDEVSLIPQSPGAHPDLKYNVIKGGAGVGLYIYRWSEAIAMDILTRFRPTSLLDPAVGLEYRRRILEPGGSVPPEEMLRGFLGRDTNSDALVRLFD